MSSFCKQYMVNASEESREFIFAYESKVILRLNIYRRRPYSLSQRRSGVQQFTNNFISVQNFTSFRLYFARRQPCLLQFSNIKYYALY